MIELGVGWDCAYVRKPHNRVEYIRFSVDDRASEHSGVGGQAMVAWR